MLLRLFLFDGTINIPGIKLILTNLFLIWLQISSRRHHYSQCLYSYSSFVFVLFVAVAYCQDLAMLLNAILVRFASGLWSMLQRSGSKGYM